MVEEILSKFHQVGRLLKSKVQLLCHQQEIVVVDHVSWLFLEPAQEKGTHSHDAPILDSCWDTVGSETHTKARAWLIPCYIVIIIKGCEVGMGCYCLGCCFCGHQKTTWPPSIINIWWKKQVVQMSTSSLPSLMLLFWSFIISDSVGTRLNPACPVPSVNPTSHTLSSSLARWLLRSKFSPTPRWQRLRRARNRRWRRSRRGSSSLLVSWSAAFRWRTKMTEISYTTWAPLLWLRTTPNSKKSYSDWLPTSRKWTLRWVCNSDDWCKSK